MESKGNRETKDNSESNLEKCSKLIPLMAPIKWTPISRPFTVYLVPSYSDSGLGYMTCFHQWDHIKLEASSDLKKLLRTSTFFCFSVIAMSIFSKLA